MLLDVRSSKPLSFDELLDRFLAIDVAPFCNPISDRADALSEPLGDFANLFSRCTDHFIAGATKPEAMQLPRFSSIMPLDRGDGTDLRPRWGQTDILKCHQRLSGRASL